MSNVQVLPMPEVAASEVKPKTAKKARKPKDPNAPKKEKKAGAKGKGKVANSNTTAHVKGVKLANKAKERPKIGRLPSQKKILKKPISPWIAFMNAQIEVMGKEDARTGQPMKFVQKSSMMSSLWRKMSAEEKAKYVEISKLDQARYAQQLENLSPEQKKQLKEIRKRKKEKKAGEPVKAKSAFMCFHAASRGKIVADNPGIKFADVGKKMGELWTNMSAEEQKPYHEAHAKDKARYLAEMEAFNKQRDQDKEQKKAEREQKQQEKDKKKEALKAADGMQV
jgi:hypothetical protein